MHKPGAKYIRRGIGALIVGAVVAGAIYSGLFPDVPNVLAWGPIFIGAVVLIVGLFQLITFNLKNPEQKAMHYAKIEVRAIAIAMIYQALSDDGLNDDEEAMIKSLFRQYTGMELENDVFDKLLKQARSSRFDYLEKLEQFSHSISDQAKATIIRMSYLVLLADQIVAENETETIFKIAKAIGIEQEHALQITLEVEKAMDNPDNQTGQ